MKNWQWALLELSVGRSVKRTYVSEHHTVKPFTRVLKPDDNLPVLVSDITATNWESAETKPVDPKDLEQVGRVLSEWEYRQK